MWGKSSSTLEDLGIAENTLVVWMSDNGPMYDFFPESSSSAYTGGKGDVLEGGVHVPAIAWWPGIIEPNQLSAELLQVTDMYTTAARIGGAMDGSTKGSESSTASSRAATCCQLRRVAVSIYFIIPARMSEPFGWVNTNVTWLLRTVGCRARTSTIFIKTRRRSMVSWRRCFGLGCRSTILPECITI